MKVSRLTWGTTTADLIAIHFSTWLPNLPGKRITDYKRSNIIHTDEEQQTAKVPQRMRLMHSSVMLHMCVMETMERHVVSMQVTRVIWETDLLDSHWRMDDSAASLNLANTALFSTEKSSLNRQPACFD